MRVELDAGYSMEVDTLKRDDWDSLLQTFDDASIYQSWPYESVISGEKKASHLLLMKGREIVAMTQVRILKLPLAKMGVAHTRCGPVWRRKGAAPDTVVFQQALRALRNEYACRRGLVIRIVPFLFSEDSHTIGPILEEEGFEHLSLEEAQRTLLIDLGKKLEDLRKGLDQKWRNRLNQAERFQLQVAEGCGDDLFAQFIPIFEEMYARKNLLKGTDVNQYRAMQAQLPEPMKMRIWMAYAESIPISGLICSRIGDTAVNLLAATANDGLKSQASYLLQWKAIGWFKENGLKRYDLNGINPEANPGTYHFKSGLCGKNGKDVRYMGTFASHENPVANGVIGMANFMRVQYRKGKRFVHGFVNVPGKEARRKAG